MSVGPFPLAQVIERLQRLAPSVRTVGTSADLETALDTPPNANPALFVVSEERAGPAKYTGPMTVQNVDVSIKVVRLVRSAGSERHGVGARLLTDQVVAEIRHALIGWTPGDAFDAITLVAGRDDRYRGGWLSGQEIFRTSYRIQTQASP